MSQTVRDLIREIPNHWFFLSAVIYAVALPLSPALVSISAVLMLVSAVVEYMHNKTDRNSLKSPLWYISGIFFIYLLSSAIGGFQGMATYDLKKNSFYLILPLAFIFGKPFSAYQMRFLFYAFVSAVLMAILIAWIRWLRLEDYSIIAVHGIALVSHIRFSFQLILAIWFSFLFLVYNKKFLTPRSKGLWAAASVLSFAFLIFQQSLTGLVAFTGSVLFFLVYILYTRNKRIRIWVLIGGALLIVGPYFYIHKTVSDFYNIEELDRNEVDRRTAAGNKYFFDFNNKMVENGHYVYVYICEDELRKEWNKRSDKDYDTVNVNSFPLSATLIRYMTSLGLRKDAVGMHQLTEQDIKNVEAGMSNVIFEKRFSLKPRLYQTVWEYYIYTHTGNANQKSLSQRIEFAKAALLIIGDHPWLGVGTANWKKEFNNAFKINEADLSEDLYASSHNQYLNYMVKFGIPGFVLLLIFFILPIYKSGAGHNLLFLVFIVSIFVANFADSNLESHMGSAFFLYFYCLFIRNGSKNFLILEENRG